jgi:hypothetical protein
MPLFAHSDLTTTLWISFTWISKHQLLLSSDPPAIFIVLGSFYQLMAQFFSPQFVNYITSGTAFTPNNLLPVFALLEPGINSVLLIAKLPFLLLDVAASFVMLNLFEDGNKAFSAFKLWLLCPVSIFVSYVFGQYDIFPVFFILLALFFLKKNKFSWSLLFLGLGSVFKVIGAALIPLVIVYFIKVNKIKTLKAKVLSASRLTVLALLPLIVLPILFSVVPQYYESVNYALPRGSLFNGFFGNTFYSRGTEAQPFISGLLTFLLDFSASLQTYLASDTLFLVPFSYAIVFLAVIYTKELSFEKIYGYFTIFLLSYYAFSLFLPQWFLWVQPFLILLIIENRKVFFKLYLFLIPLYFIYIWQWDSGLTTHLLIPTVYQAMFWAGPIKALSDIGLQPNAIIGLFRTFFSAVCIFTAFCITKETLRKGTKTNKPKANITTRSQ